MQCPADPAQHTKPITGRRHECILKRDRIASSTNLYFCPVKLTGVKQSEQLVPPCSVCGLKRSGSCYMSRGGQVCALLSVVLALRASRHGPLY